MDENNEVSYIGYAFISHKGGEFLRRYHFPEIEGKVENFRKLVANEINPRLIKSAESIKFIRGKMSFKEAKKIIDRRIFFRK